MTLRTALIRLAIRCDLNLNWIFDPAESWRLKEPLTLGRRRKVFR